MKKPNVKKIFYDFLDSVESPIILSGWEIQKCLYEKTFKHTYPSTLLRYARDYADITGSDFICLDKKESKYKFERFVKLEGAILN